MCAAWLAAETLDGIRLGLIRLEHGQQLRDGEQILNALREVQQFELSPLPAHRGVRTDNFPEAGAIDVGDAFEVEQQFLPVLLDERLILSFRSLSPSPSVILPLRSRIVTPLTTRSSICIAASSKSDRAGGSVSPRRWPDVQPPEAPAPGPTVSRENRPASVLRGLQECQEIQRFALLLVPRARLDTATAGSATSLNCSHRWGRIHFWTAFPDWSLNRHRL